VRKVCDWNFSGGNGSDCPKIAVANMGLRWYCAVHYDRWMIYYRWLLEEGQAHNIPEEVLKELRA
jgi:hypothetical protein